MHDREKHLPHEDVRVPAGLTELSAPTETLTIEGEVFGDPQNRIRSTAEFLRSECLSKSTCVAAKTEATLTPWVGPQKLLVVVDIFPEKGPNVASAVHPFKMKYMHVCARLSHMNAWRYKTLKGRNN